MSRFVEALNSHGPVLHVRNIRDILVQLTERLESDQAHVDFEFPYFLEKPAPVTGAVGLLDYTIRFSATLAGGPGGKVDFIATYSSHDLKEEYHEVGEFKKSGGQWFYDKGTVVPTQIVRDQPKVGRNDPCPCGSGKKYKVCHGR